MRTKMIVLVGSHGSGKGVVGGLLEWYLIHSLGSDPSLVYRMVIGDYFKTLKERDPENGAEKQIKERFPWKEFECGRPLPDDLVVSVFDYQMQMRLRQSVTPHYIVVDGVPGNCEQALLFNDRLRLWGIDERIFVHLDVDGKECVRRLLNKLSTVDRLFDNNKRMDIINRQVVWDAGQDAFLQSLRQFSRVVSVKVTDSMGSDDVAKEILSKIAYFVPATISVSL